VAPGIDDARLFREIRESIEILKLKEFEDSIFMIVAAVLHLGNVRFDDKTLGDSNN
jgi:myosin heavy subunit